MYRSQPCPIACWWQPTPREVLKSMMRVDTLQPRLVMLSPFDALTIFSGLTFTGGSAFVHWTFVSCVSPHLVWFWVAMHQTSLMTPFSNSWQSVRFGPVGSFGSLIWMFESANACEFQVV